MLDQEFHNAPPPSPSQVLKVVVDIFGPTPDPLNPFNDRRFDSQRKLATDMLVGVYGADHPVSQIIRAYDNYSARPMASEEAFTDWASIIEQASKTICADLQEAAEYAASPCTG